MKNFPKYLALLVEEAGKATASKEAALTVLHSLDLTSLNDDDTPEKIDGLIKKADQGSFGHVAATCVYPKFLTQTFNATAQKGIGRATVINFPSGQGTPEQTTADVKQAVKDGANEIDIVLDYKSFLAGDYDKAQDLLSAARDAAGSAKLKVILETSEFTDYVDVHSASILALSYGADFLKTSTGKSDKGGATLEAAAAMMQAIKDMGLQGEAGIKISGGVKTVADGAKYISLIESMMGEGWISTDTFRIGASGVLNDVTQTLGITPKPATPQAPASGY